jgi:hypothetical protein
MKNKDLGFNINEIDDLFHADNDVIDGMEVVNIPIEDIGVEAEGKAKTLIEDLTRFYYDEEFLKQNPNFRKRVDNDMESLRMLLKMRAADEVTHDVLIKAIAGNSGNASLYRALTTVQSTILSITTKIENIVNNLTAMIKNYQLELNFKQENVDVDNNDQEATTINTTHRGSKAFIEQMQKIESADMFTDNNTSIE